jgi:mRNA-degrading endonuclease RelE of RelBE toxin-antitoxin system
VTDERYTLVISPTARRQVAEVLPESPASAAQEFILGPLLDNPHRVGKRLEPPLSDRLSARRGTYRVIYRIDDRRRTVTVLNVLPRSDAYRT